MRRRIHEHRAIALLQTALGPEALHSELAVPRVAHSIDALLDIDEPTDLWGPLGPLVGHRTLVLEHESRAPSRLKLHTAVGKLLWITRAEWRRQGETGRRHPMLLFLSAGCPRWVTTGELGFVPGSIKGVYTLAWRLLPEVAFLHLRGLPDAPGLSLLKLIPTPRDPDEADAGIRRLNEDPLMLQSTRTLILEAIMNHQIPATSEERWLTVEALRKEGHEEGRQAALRHLALRLLDPEQIASLDGIVDPDELERRILTLLGRH